MSDEIGDPTDRDSSSRLEMDFRSASFPSDALSVARLRKVFPQHFDGSDTIVDGYACNDFFFPSGVEKPNHLLRLTQLICDERVVGSGGYYRCLKDKYPEVYEQEDIESVEHSKIRLEDNYQFFKLADSPETARLLIQQVEEEGEKQALRDRSRGR